MNCFLIPFRGDWKLLGSDGKCNASLEINGSNLGRSSVKYCPVGDENGDEKTCQTFAIKLV